MQHNFSSTQIIRKQVVRSAGGVVAAQHRKAAEAGAAVLAGGGTAIDAAVATSFALGVVEPWMSGPLGGGAMVFYQAAENNIKTIYFGMKASEALLPEAYPVVTSEATGLFGWPGVEGDRNLHGATAMAVPGTVAGMELAHQKYGTLPWHQLLQPAIELAKEGLLVDWYTSLMIAGSAKWLSQDSDAARMFLDEGTWPKAAGWTASTQEKIDLSSAASTLEFLAVEGPRSFYEGEIAKALVSDVTMKGGFLTHGDLAQYKPIEAKPLTVNYRGAKIFTAPEMTSGPNLIRFLERLSAHRLVGKLPGEEAFLRYAEVLAGERNWRLSNMGDNEDARSPACTTHFSIVDRLGNMCSVTQTLLSAFGSRVVSPTTGFLANNGIMWFDPVPGNRNSIAPSRRCLMNICPTLGEVNERRFALGASGGRKILSAVAQLVSFLVDFDMTLEEAFHHPRIDASGTTLAMDPTLPFEVKEALSRQFVTTEAPRTTYAYPFACHVGVLSDHDGNQGSTESTSPWGDTIHENDVMRPPPVSPRTEDLSP